MRFDWNIPVWQVFTAIWITFVFFFTVIRKLDILIAILKEYPPHKHIGDTIIFPKGMKPDNGVHTGAD